VRATSVDANGFAGGKKASKSVKLTEEGDPLFGAQGDREVVNLATKREPIVAGGTRQLR
jgi:hypothetical protein